MSEPLTLVIFGASGDLTGRKLIPALYSLKVKGYLPPEARIVGVARSPFTDDAFRTQMQNKVTEFGEGFDEGKWTEFAARLHYVGTDLSAVVSSRPNSRAYHVQQQGETITEMPIVPRYLGAGG